MTTNLSFRIPAAVSAALSAFLLATIVTTTASAAISPSCAQRIESAGARSLGRAVRCLARSAVRDGSAVARCVAQAKGGLASVAQETGGCFIDPPALGRTVETCAADVLARVPSTGRCAVRMLRAVAASLRTRTPAPRLRTRCRAIERASGCEGDCEGLAETLTACWAAAAQPPPDPTLPTAPREERIVLFGAHEADAISTVTVSGQDEVTQTARVVIAPGSEPLYVALTSYESVIWRLEGAVSRVAHLVVLGYGTGGVTGIPADRVAFPSDLPADLPRYFYNPDSPEAQRIRGYLEATLGRPIDVVSGSYSVGTLQLPAATVALNDISPDAPVGFDPIVYVSQGLWFNPGGVVDIDPSLVVSSRVAEAYEVLPGGFGLAHLVAGGGLEARDDFYYIARAIPRFPAGLYGAHSVTFVLGRGVPMPAGSQGHSCVVSEETGLPLENPWLCRDYPPPSSASCAFPAASAGAEVVLFGAYEADTIANVTINGQDEDTGTARVVVEPGTTPLYIAIAAYDDTIWRFEGATERVERVVLLGYGAQGETGLPAERVTNWSNAASSSCVGAFFDVKSPEALAARSATGRLLGRPVDAFAGGYTVGTLAVPSMTVSESPTPTDAPPGFDPGVFLAQGLRFASGGIVEIDSSAVVSINPAEPYEVLPCGFGLAQLVGSGALELRDASFVFPTFYIARAIPRFPPALYGAHLVWFVLGAGVPMPAGNPGHSCVFSEETGEPILGSLCLIGWS